MRSGVQDQPSQDGETPSLLKKKNTKIRWSWLRVPVIPATWEVAHICDPSTLRGRGGQIT